MIWTPQAMAEWLNRLPFVTWDRMSEAQSDQGHTYIVVYGWISRDDGHADYVQFDFASWSDRPGWATSSAKHSEQIGELLNPGDEHFPCARVEHVFGDLVPQCVRIAA